MANLFKEAEMQKKVTPGSKVVKVAHDPEPKSEPKITTANPLAGTIEQKAKGKSYGFYLSSEAIDNLEKLAKMNKCSNSKALDALLKTLSL